MFETEITTDVLSDFMAMLRSVDGFSLLGKSKNLRVIRICNQYLDSVLLSRRPDSLQESSSTRSQ